MCQIVRAYSTLFIIRIEKTCALLFFYYKLLFLNQLLIEAKGKGRGCGFEFATEVTYLIFKVHLDRRLLIGLDTIKTCKWRGGEGY